MKLILVLTLLLASSNIVACGEYKEVLSPIIDSFGTSAKAL